MKSTPVYSHSPAKTGGTGKLLHEHLREVADRAKFYASAFNAGPQAEWAGLTHDIGKYADLFQRRLEGKESGIDHWTLGAAACLCLSKNLRPLAMASSAAVLGHHIGLQQADELSFRALYDLKDNSPTNPAGLRLSHLGQTAEALFAAWRNDGFEEPLSTGGIAHDCKRHSAFLNDIRFIFSALTDADFIQTQAHFERKTPEDLGRDQGPPLNPIDLLPAIDALITEAATGKASQDVRTLRSETLADCIAAATLPPGLFTLTAPTGSGKTLSILRFAAAHAAQNNMRRVVYVAPYLTIFDQTVKLLQEIVDRAGVDPDNQRRYLLEHASLTRLDAETPDDPANPDNPQAEGRRSLQSQLSENWDAPFIATTNVQLLESLFSNRSSKCRKLHRLAKSIILLDEVQTLPQDLACATLATLSRLTEPPFSCTVLFMTATQPAFDQLNADLIKHWRAPWLPSEIATNIPRTFALARRFVSTWPAPDEILTWDMLATELASLAEPQQALVIVNVKADAVKLLNALPPDLQSRHLSTSMCPRHRKDVFESVKDDLSNGRNCILVATQCVEAGVDLDFPKVYRAMAPLDSIAQASGRCNRHGAREFGDFRVFETIDRALPRDKAYKIGTAITRSILRSQGNIDLNDPAIFRSFYSEMYAITELGNPTTGRQKALFEATVSHDFVKVAELYRIIEDNTVQVVVPYSPDVFDELEKDLRTDGFSAAWIRRARPYTVNAFRNQDGRIEDNCIPIPTRSGKPKYIPDWFLLGNPEHYDSQQLGLTFPKPGAYLNA